MNESVLEAGHIEQAVRERYSSAAQAREAELCCPVSYDARYLAVIPEEVIARDYGCGDPSRHVRPGETVLDLGSGSGKIAFIASQVVGPTGSVIGIDMNDEMLDLSRSSAPTVADRIGYANVRFGKGRIQDLALDIDQLDEFLKTHPVRSAAELDRLDAETARLRRESPLVATDSVDVIVSNCVLNLVSPNEKARLFSEIFDEDVPLALQQNPDLWSGCISGALREDRFLSAFEDAGFHGIEILARAAEPWRTVDGIEFRSVTVAAYKGKAGPCFDHKQAIVYRGPFRQVVDDDGHVLRRGVRTAVCEKTFRLFASAPYREHVELIAPRAPVSADDAPPFPCAAGALVRDPRETKGADYALTTAATGLVCEPGGGCC